MTSDLYDELSGDQVPLNTPQRVLTIGAHPDDAEFGAGACLGRWAADGADIVMLVVTDGSKGSWNPAEDKARLVARRKEEQSRAAGVLGATRVIHLDHTDGELEHTWDLRKVLARHIREIRPDVVLTHDPWQRYQLHPDHRATGMAAVDAVVAAREPLMFTDVAEPAHRPGAVLLWSADEPDHAEPIEPRWFDVKVEALLCHSSQGPTTMAGAESGAEKRVAFIDHLALWHAKSGDAFGIGPAESFKKIVP